MKKIAIASNIVFDIIEDIGGNTLESLGGPACYGSTIARTFGFDTILATRVGKDMHQKNDLLIKNGISLESSNFDNNYLTSKFKIVLKKGGDKDLYLLSKCSSLDNQFILDCLNKGSDGIILSPVFDEVSKDIFRLLSKEKKDKFVILDPQGFLRDWNENTNIITHKNVLDIDIRGITGIKTDLAELSSFTNGVLSLEGMKNIKKKFNLEFVILTDKNHIMLLHKNILYSVSIKKFEDSDFVGLGDMLTTSFSCSYIKEQDPLWALCFGVGTVISSLMSGKKGLEKVPKKMSVIERNASYLYNTVKFQIVD
jgi:hypothetical protein